MTNEEIIDNLIEVMKIVNHFYLTEGTYQCKAHNDESMAIVLAIHAINGGDNAEEEVI